MTNWASIKPFPKPKRSNFNARPKSGEIAKEEPALRPKIAGARQPEAIGWMQKPLRPPQAKGTP